MEDRLKNSGGRESAQLRSFLASMQSVIKEYGFHYLNDPANDKHMKKLQELSQAVLKKLDDPKLSEQYHKDQEVILKREDVMLDNVYAHCKANPVQNGLMFIGSGHRQSIMQKIEERRESGDIEIDWRYYADLISVSNKSA